MNNLPEFRRGEIARRGEVDRYGYEGEAPKPTFILLGHDSYARQQGFELWVANEAQIKRVELSRRDFWNEDRYATPCGSMPRLPAVSQYQLDAQLRGLTVTWGNDLREALEVLARHTQ